MAFDLQSIPKRIYKTLANLRTGIVLLILVVIAAALGTFILQRPATDPDKMQAAYSPQALFWLDRTGLTDVFHAWWFLGLLTLVSLSIVFVSIERFPNAWRFYARPYRRTDSHFRAANAYKTELPIRDAEQGLDAAERALSKLRWPVQRISDESGASLYSEKHRFSVMAVYLIHASLLLIFAGGIVDGIFGYSGFMMLEPGQQSNIIALQGRHTEKVLPFEVKCYGAGQENYTDGSPKKWWSKLAVIDGGKEVAGKEIVVNDPLVYKGLRFFQASYGPTGKIAALKATATPEGGSPRDIVLHMNEPVELDAGTSVSFTEYIPDFFIRDNQVFKRSDNPGNPAFRLQVKNNATNEEALLWFFPRYQADAQGQKTSYAFTMTGVEPGYFTGLQVAHEPGQWLVWAGCLLMTFGLFVAFYLVHMRLWVTPITNTEGKLVLWVGGAANKNKDRFEQKFEGVVNEIRNELGKQKSTPASPRSAQHLEEREAELAGVK
jgi:cytochrome c biogenesis protein